MLEIALDKYLTDNCLVETRTKLELRVPAAVVKCGLTWVQLPLRLQSLINGISWNGMSWVILISENLYIKCTEAGWNYNVREACCT